MRVRVYLLPQPRIQNWAKLLYMKVQYHVSTSDLTDVEDVGGWVKNFTDSELDSDERRGTTSRLRWWYERLRCRVMAACVATPSHEKTYPSGCASGYFTLEGWCRAPPAMYVVVSWGWRADSVNRVSSGRRTMEVLADDPTKRHPADSNAIGSPPKAV